MMFRHRASATPWDHPNGGPGLLRQDTRELDVFRSAIGGSSSRDSVELTSASCRVKFDAVNWPRWVARGTDGQIQLEEGSHDTPNLIPPNL